MTERVPGTARHLPKDRFASFGQVSKETESELAAAAGAPILPPRTREPEQKPAKLPPKRKVRAAPDEPSHQAEPAPKRGPGRPRLPDEEKTHPSNVHLPVQMLEQVRAVCDRDRISHGELILLAIEATHERLDELLQPTAPASSLFSARRTSRAARLNSGPLTPIAYRLRREDFRVIDDLAQRCGAASRGHLITTALAEYFKTQSPS